MKPFLTAYWKNLIMLNYSVDPALLKPLLPKGTELDYFNGNCYASLVGFMFLNTRIKNMAVPFYKNFEEFNFRFYIRIKENDTWRRGVVFFKEIVPRRMISFIANTLYGEHYHYHPMKNSLIENDETIEVKYEWLYKNEWNHLHAVAEKTSMPASEEEAFIAEHYWGYTKLNDTTTSEYQVTHPAWNIQQLKSFHLHCNIKEMYGDDWLPYLTQQPASAFMATGSAVSIGKRNFIK